jgi:hypothetical protein
VRNARSTRHRDLEASTTSAAGSSVLVVSTNLPSSLASRAIAAWFRVTLPLAIRRKRA